MRKEEKNKKSEEEISLEDVPFVGGLLKGLEKFVDLAERVEKAGGEIKKTGHIKGTGRHKDVQGIYGFTIRTGLDKKTKIEPFGNIKKTKEGPKVAKAREPVIDVFDEKDHVTVIAELPGVHEKTIRLDLKGDILLLKAHSGDREYIKEILLPAKIDFASKIIKFRNGILEVKFRKHKNTKT